MPAGMALDPRRHEMSFPGRCYPLIVDIVPQRCADLIDHGRTGHLVQRRDGTGHWSPRQIAQHKFPRGRITSKPASDLDADIAETCSGEQGTELVGARESEGCSETRGCLGTDIALEGFGQCGVEGLVLKITPHG